MTAEKEKLRDLIVQGIERWTDEDGSCTHRGRTINLPKGYSEMVNRGWPAIVCCAVAGHEADDFLQAQLEIQKLWRDYKGYGAYFCRLSDKEGREKLIQFFKEMSDEDLESILKAVETESIA